jgi:hypothetical protein
VDLHRRVAGVGGGMTPGLNGNATASMFRDIAMKLSELWVRHVRPYPFTATFHIGAVEVEMSIREVEPNTKPIRYRDEDEGIAG